MAALEAAEEDVDSVLVVLPSDQLIVDVENFSSVIDKAVNLAAQGSIVVLGIPPNRPETGYGYIQKSLEIGSYEEFKVSCKKLLNKY